MPKNTKNERKLTLLGGPAAKFPERPDRATLETFPNKFAQRDYVIRFETEDFTSLCPVTGQPDFAKLLIEYVPGVRCIETKSLKYYLASYRNTQAFNEEVVNRILDDLVAVCSPREMRVHGEFAARGGISLSVDAVHSGRRKRGTK